MIKKIFKYFIQGLTILFFALAFVVMIIGIYAANSNKPMSLFGYIYSVVPTESMVPDINPGDFVFSKKIDFDDLQVGDDIVYYSNEHNVYIVHRILSENPDGSFVMKGINNPTSDDEFVTKDNYIAKVVKVFSFLHLGNIVVKHRGLIFGLIFCIFLGLCIVQGCKIVLTIKEEKLEQQKEKNEEEKKNYIENERNKMRDEILREIQEKNNKNEKAK